jgi:dihydrofolate reductase
VRLALIAAIARNRGIGKDGALPWHLPEDLKRFKTLTMGHTILMGRRTHESIGRALPGRRNVVLTRTPIPGIETYPTIEEALEALAGEERVFVIGGGTLYAALLSRADELYLTLVDREVDADTFFPPYAELLETHFREVFRQEHAGYTYVDFVRLSQDAPPTPRV